MPKIAQHRARIKGILANLNDGNQPQARTPEVLPPDVPAIVCSGKQLPEITADMLQAVKHHNVGNSLFLRGGSPVCIVQDEKGRQVILDLSVAMMRGRVARAANFYHMTSQGLEPCFPPKEAIKDLLALPPKALGFPKLTGIVESPCLRPDGSIISAPGYDRETGLYYAPGTELNLPRIPDKPTEEGAFEALCKIIDALCDFPFVGCASEANAIATLLTPVVRPAITGATPLALFDAPAAGTGKTLLAEAVSLIATGREASLFSAPREGEEWRKALTAVLRESAQVVIMDNVSLPLDSPELCKALTALCWGDRILGHSRTANLPVRCTWIATGNNIRLGGDLPRRCYWVRIDAKDSQPQKRTGFQHPNLKAHILEERGELLAALLTMARAWFVAGRPAPQVTPLGSYESWTYIVGGILEHAGIAGFLTNCDALCAQGDDESLQWQSFLLARHQTFRDGTFTSAGVFAKCAVLGSILRQALPEFVGEFIDREGAFQRRLGQSLREREGRRFGHSQVHVERAGTLHGAALWRVKKGS